MKSNIGEGMGLGGVTDRFRLDIPSGWAQSVAQVTIIRAARCKVQHAFNLPSHVGVCGMIVLDAG